MRKALVAFAVAIPALVWAEDRQPYVVHNGRGSSAPAVAAPAAASNHPLGAEVRPTGMGANAVTAAVAAAAAAGAPAPSAPTGQAFVGGGAPRRGVVQRGSAAHRRGAVRRATGDQTDAPPPYFDKPGALIRTEGQLPVYSDPGNARTHSVEGGGLVDIDQRKARDSGRAPGVHWGAPDTRPPVNPGSGAGGNAVTANGPAPGSEGSAGGGAMNGGSANGDSGGGRGGNGGSRPDAANAPLSGTGFDGSF